jgi:hypothetical protein
VARATLDLLFAGRGGEEEGVRTLLARGVGWLGGLPRASYVISKQRLPLKAKLGHILL